MKSIIKNWIKNEATDDELIQIVSEVNSWDGSLEEYAFYDMDSLDEFFRGVKPTELLSKLADDFDINDEGYKDTMYGLESCSKDDIVEEIKNNAEEIAEQIVQAMEETDLYLPDSLQEMME